MPAYAGGRKAPACKLSALRTLRCAPRQTADPPVVAALERFACVRAATSLQDPRRASRDLRNTLIAVEDGRQPSPATRALLTKCGDVAQRLRQVVIANT